METGERDRLITNTKDTHVYNTIPSYERAENSPLSESNNNIGKVPTLTSCRWMTTYMCFLGMILTFTVRANLVMAFVCLFPKGFKVENDTMSALSFDSMDGLVYEIPTNTSENTLMVLDAGWNDKTQGLALSAYYYGCIVSPILGGYAATRSAKSVMIVTMALAAIVTVLTPMAIPYSAYVTVAMRVVIGLCGGVYEPAMQHMISSWAPKEERGKMTALSQSGKVVGNVVSFVLSGVLCTCEFLSGWPLTFYGTGIVCFLWVLLLCLLVYDSPNEHPRISAPEREFINQRLRRPKNTSTKSAKQSCGLFMKMMTCPPFIACLLVKFAGAWVFNVQSSNQPMWVRDVLGFDVEQNGILSSLPYIGQFLGSLVSGVVMDYASKSKCSTTVVSKTTFCVCLMLPASAIFSLSFLTAEERILAVCLTVFTTTVYSAVPVALRLVLIELAPRYTGILMGILTTVGCIPGMIAPLVTSIITSDGTAQSWAEIFYMCSGMYAGAALIFFCFGNSKEQSWSD